jgi:hypothetical protein
MSPKWKVPLEVNLTILPPGISELSSHECRITYTKNAMALFVIISLEMTLMFMIRNVIRDGKF